MENKDKQAFIMQEAMKMVKQKLQTKMVEMYSKPKPILTQKDGDDLYILDTIFDVCPDPKDDSKGKSGKLVFEIIQGKIRDYTRIHDEYDYKNSEYDYDEFGGMKLIFHFTKKPQY